MYQVTVTNENPHYLVSDVQRPVVWISAIADLTEFCNLRREAACLVIFPILPFLLGGFLKHLLRKISVLF